MKTKSRRRLRVAVIAGASVAMGLALLITVLGGTFLPRHYLQPWDKDYYKRFSDPRMQVIAHGVLAANSHNMQPWKVQLDSSDAMTFRLFADGTRLTPQVDPLARQITVSQGTFLEYVTLAAEKLGYSCDIELFPEGEYDAEGTPETMAAKPVAVVGLGATVSAAPVVSTQVATLYECMFLPDTVRVPYEDSALTAEQSARLTEWTPDPSVEIVVLQDAQDRARLGELAIQGAEVEGGLARINQENAALFRGTEYQKNKYRYGFSVEGQGTGGLGLWFTEGLLAVFPSLAKSGDTDERFVKQTTVLVEHTPAYVLIRTRDNSRRSQILAGLAYARVQLTAQSMGMAVHPLSQILEEYPEMGSLHTQVHAEYAPDGGTIQMLVRVGRPTREVPHSMRREAADLLIQ